MQKDMAGNVSGHYSARSDVILRFEFIKARHSRVGLTAWPHMLVFCLPCLLMALA